MNLRRILMCGLLVAAIASVSAVALAEEESKLVIGGTTYTKWLWGNQRDQGSLYNFTTVPGEGYGNNGQGSEVELLLDAKLSKQVEVKARIHSRFSQNFWTNFGGFGGSLDPNGDGVPGPCVSGDCGEFDSRSNQYVKLRGVSVTLTPGYSWIDSATIGANDFGQFDPFVIGRIRYIDRDNGAGLLFQGSIASRKVTWDFVRISLPRLWAGPSFNTGSYHAADGAYGLQWKFAFIPEFDFGLIGDYTNDIEIDSRDTTPDNGRNLRTRFRSSAVGAKFGVHPSPTFDISGAYYHSWSYSSDLFAPSGLFGIAGFSPVILGEHDDAAWKVNFDANDPFGVGLTFHLEGFNIGAEYEALMASRREADVLLTEGHDSTFAFPGPSNAAFGVFGGNPTRIGYGGWDGTAQQVPSINVDNEFTDFDEPMAETVIGWKGITFVPVYSKGDFELAGEYTYIDYNTNWQAWGDNSRSVTDSIYPSNELDTGVGHNFRSAYAPFQDKKTHLAVIRAKYVIDVGRGIDIWGKCKWISEDDKRLNDTKYLPYQSGDCPGGGVPCFNARRFYGSGGSTADIYGNPGVITVGSRTGYQWKPFDSIDDDDRDLSYRMGQLGLGYQFSDDLYASLTGEYYKADLEDGNTALQAYQLHEMASGKHQKTRLIAKARYILAGAEIGFEYQYNFGTFEPDFGTGYVPQRADQGIQDTFGYKVGTLGFRGRFGGWNSLEKREFSQQRLKAFLKVQF